MQILLIQNEILNFFLILIGSAVFAKLFHFCLVNYVKKIAKCYAKNVTEENQGNKMIHSYAPQIIQD